MHCRHHCPARLFVCTGCRSEHSDRNRGSANSKASLQKPCFARSCFAGARRPLSGLPKMLGHRLSRFAAASMSPLPRYRNASWKTPTALSSNQGRSSRSTRRDSQGRSPRHWDSRDSSNSDTSSRESSRDVPQQRSSFRSQQQQQQQQQRRQPRQQIATQDDRDSWNEYDTDKDTDTYNDNVDDGDGDYRYPARPSKASYREQLFGEGLYGVAPVLAALKAGRRTAHQLLMQEGLTPGQRKDARGLQEVQKLVQHRGAAVRTVSKHELNMLAGNRPHQGLILDASPLQWDHLEVFPAAEDLPQQQSQQQTDQAGVESSSTVVQRHPVWLAVDEVIDPQNLGAMIRSAYCLGVSGVLACSRNCSPLSPVVCKASAGAAELMTLHSCRSMPRTLADAASKGWAVIGAAAEADAVPISQFQVERPTILVMGNEGYGLRPTVKRCCTQLVQIPMAPVATVSSGSQQLIDSLNVSVATGILLHQLIQTATIRW